jgi:hypothetical protein
MTKIILKHTPKEKKNKQKKNDNNEREKNKIKLNRSFLIQTEKKERRKIRIKKRILLFILLHELHDRAIEDKRK